MIVYMDLSADWYQDEKEVRECSAGEYNDHVAAAVAPLWLQILAWHSKHLLE